MEAAETGPEAASPELTPRRGLLDELGTRWSVWVGGIALALGAIFFLRYSIEAGFFGPAMRIAVAAILGALMLGAGEWLRRGDPETQTGVMKNAYIPGVLSAVGILTLLGTVYVSHALYGFISVAPAFALLGLLSLGALFLGLLQGPAISGLGLAGSMITPLLVGDKDPSYAVLYAYLVMVLAAAMVLSRARNWSWLSAASTFGALTWAFMGVEWHRGTELSVWLLYLSAIFGMILLINVMKVLPFPDRDDDVLQNKVLPIAVFGISSALLLLMLNADVMSLRSLYACLGGVAVGLFIAWRWSRLVWIAIFATALSVLAMALRGFYVVGLAPKPFGRYVNAPVAIEGPWADLFLLACAAALVLLVVSVIASRRACRSIDDGSGIAAGVWASVGAVGPLATFVSLWWLGTKGGTQISFGLAGIALGVLTALTTESFFRSAEHGSESRSVPLSAILSPLNIFAASSCAAFAFGLFASFSGALLTLALCTIIMAIGFLYMYRSLPPLRGASTALGGLAILHALYTISRISGAVGPTVIFNELWIFFAAPAVACTFSAWRLSRLRSDIWSQGLEALALSFAALFAVFQVRHYMNGGDLFAPALSLEELSMQVLVGLSFSVGLSRIRNNNPDGLFPKMAMLAMGVSLLNLVFGNLLFLNPLFNASSVVKGGFILNSLILAYLLPGVFLAAIAWLQRKARPDWYVKALSVVSLVLIFTYVSEMVRLGNHGAELMHVLEGRIREMEIYTYTIVWCLLGLTIMALDWLTGRTKAPGGTAIQEILDYGTRTILGLSCLSLLFGNLLLANPMFVERVVVHGNAVWNSLLLAYLLPGLVFGVAARQYSHSSESWNAQARSVLGGLALLSTVAYCTVMTRFAYQDAWAMSIFDHAITNAEQYTYSIIWLVFAIALLGIGIVTQQREFRIGSAAVMALTAAKVFLVDTAALEGFLRALSFVGLGAVLISMGVIYQKFLVRPDDEEVGAAEPSKV